MELVEDFVRELGSYQLEGFRRIHREDVRVKENDSNRLSIVTEYDLESERRAAAFLERHFPRDSLLGEEHGNVRRDPERYWVIDPIDGTSNFVGGVVYWGPSLALFERGRLLAGWVYFPRTSHWPYRLPQPFGACPRKTPA